MLTVYNPYTGEWERLDDLNRPMPIVQRQVRLLLDNSSVTPFTPTLATSNSPSHPDIFGNTTASRANIGMAISATDADIIIPDPWRVRRFIIVCNRSGSGGTSVPIHCVLWGRLLAPDGTPTNWRSVVSVSENLNDAVPMRFALAPSAGLLHFDQYRITFRRETDSTPAPQISLVKVYLEY
jgi:hypothetical protein